MENEQQRSLLWTRLVGKLPRADKTENCLAQAIWGTFLTMRNGDFCFSKSRLKTIFGPTPLTKQNLWNPRRVRTPTPKARNNSTTFFIAMITILHARQNRVGMGMDFQLAPTRGRHHHRATIINPARKTSRHTNRS